MKRRVMDPDVYDFLEFSAEVYGGIGAYADFTTGSFVAGACPYCVWGHALDANGPVDFGPLRDNAISDELKRLKIQRATNDYAVSQIRLRRETNENRVSFAEWAKELRVVRGTKHRLPPLVLSNPLLASAA